MPKGGYRRNSGRRPTVEKTREKIEAIMLRINKHTRTDRVPIDPLTWWFSVLNNPDESTAHRNRAAEQLAMYTIPKPKPEDAEGSSDNKIQIVIKDFSTVANTTLTASTVDPLLIENIQDTNDESTDD